MNYNLLLLNESFVDQYLINYIIIIFIFREIILILK